MQIIPSKGFRGGTRVYHPLAVSFTVALWLGIIVCSICDLALSGTFSWSLYPITAIMFAWLVLLPFVQHGSKGILGSLIIFSSLIIPFLYVMSILIGNHLVASIGMRMSLYTLIYLWFVFLIFRKLKRRRVIATAFSLVLTIPCCILINIDLANTLAVSPFDVWDLLSFAIISIMSIALFVIDYFRLYRKAC